MDLRTTLEDFDYWGKFAAAIVRCEGVISRPAPPPLDGKRLSARFVEWMMMLPEGWVTDCGVSRTAALRILGNGVVPSQARAAVLEMNSRGAA